MFKASKGRRPSVQFHASRSLLPPLHNVLSLFSVQRSREVILLIDKLHDCPTMPLDSDHWFVALQHEGTAALSLPRLLCCMPILLAVTNTYILGSDPSAECVNHLPLIARLSIANLIINPFLE